MGNIDITGVVIRDVEVVDKRKIVKPSSNKNSADPVDTQSPRRFVVVGFCRASVQQKPLARARSGTSLLRQGSATLGPKHRRPAGDSSYDRAHRSRCIATVQRTCTTAVTERKGSQQLLSVAQHTGETPPIRPAVPYHVKRDSPAGIIVDATPPRDCSSLRYSREPPPPGKRPYIQLSGLRIGRPYP